jgi:anti-sigma factor RsiW
MDCKIVAILLHPYFDGELDEGTAASVKAHLSECAECNKELAALQALREATKRAVPRYTAPESLRQRLAQSSVRPSTADLVRSRGRSVLQSRWLALAASLVLVAGLSSAVTRAVLEPDGAAGSQDLLTRDLVSSHLRALAAPNPIDVASSDRHTVKPWFAGRVEVSPPTVDLSQQGFPLVGGRVDYVGSRRVAVLVYKHAQHYIDVYVLPEDASLDKPGSADTSLIMSQGLGLIHRNIDGVSVWAVSDMDRSELTTFANELAASR